MALTDLQVYIEPPPIDTGSTLPFDGVHEFCRNEDGRETLTVNIIPTPNDATNVGEAITVSLWKKRRGDLEEIVQSRKTFTFAGQVPNGGQQLTWDIREIVYSATKPFPMLRRGSYFIKVTHDTSVLEKGSETFRVCLMTTEAFERRWLEGATRQSNDDRMCRTQPSAIAGVVVSEVSKNHPMGMHRLNLVYDGQTPPMPSLSWGGTTIPIDTSLPGGLNKEYVLLAQDQQSFITVRVNPRLVPAVDATENLIIDKKKFQRKTLREWIDAECDWMEKELLKTPIEPSLVVTDDDLTTLQSSTTSGSQPLPAIPQNFDYDLKSKPISYFPASGAHWLRLRLPYCHPIKFDYLIGAVGGTRVIDINLSWVHFDAHNFVQIMPFNHSTAFSYLGLIHIGSLRGSIEIPSFWRLRYWAGIESRETPTPILDCIGMRAAVKALPVLGQAFRGGIAGQSFSKGGVSQSVTFTSSASYGVYSATIKDYKERLELLEHQLKRHYYGISLSVV